MRSAPVAYTLSLAAVVVAVAIRWLLDPLLGDELALVTLYGAIALAVWLGGYRPAILVAVLGYIACDYLFTEPRGQFGMFSDARNVAGILAYTATCCLIIAFGEAMILARRLSREKAEALQTTLLSVGDAVISTDAKGTVVFLNHVAEEVTGWTEAEARGKPLREVFNIVNEESRRPAENPVDKVLKDGRIVGLANHTVLIRRDGSERPIDDSAAPIRDGAGNITGVILVFRDITERRAAEQSQALLAGIVESSDDAIISKTLDGVIRSWNIGAERIFGYTAAEAVGRPITLIIPPELHSEERQILERLQRGEAIRHYETIRVAKDGRRLNISLTISPMRDEEGRIIGASKVGRDITEQKKSEEALRTSEQLYRAIGESIDFGVWICDPEGRNIYASESFLRMVGMTQQQCSDFGWGDVLHPDDAERTIESWKECVRTGGNWDVEHRFRGVDGKWHPVLARGVPVRNERGEITAWAGMNLDIGRLKQVEDELRQADQRKDEFLATLAHELRNPLAPICNGLEIMRRAEDDRQLVRQSRDTMERQLSHMVRLVDDLLDVSRITRDKLELRKERVELASIIHQAIETCRPLADESQQELIVNLPKDPMYLHGDAVRLAQVFSNLINNACKYTNVGGRITLTAEREGSEAVVRVKDTGSGIPPEEIEAIFDMFAQVDGSLERAHGGLGIGLTLVKRLVQLHGGTVEARSEGRGKGSEFIVRLPVLVDSPATTKPQVAAVNGLPAGRRILVVDDNRDSATSLAMLLKLTGNETHLAHDGLEAVAAAERVRPEVILLDIGLPNLNGYDVCKAIREQPWGQNIIMVAITGWGQDEDRRKSHEAGFDGHLVKPVDHAALGKLLGEIQRTPA